MHEVGCQKWGPASTQGRNERARHASRQATARSYCTARDAHPAPTADHSTPSAARTSSSSGRTCTSSWTCGPRSSCPCPCPCSSSWGPPPRRRRSSQRTSCNRRGAWSAHGQVSAGVQCEGSVELELQTRRQHSCRGSTAAPASGTVCMWVGSRCSKQGVLT